MRERRSLLPYGDSFTAGVFVAAGDVDGNGEVDIVTGSGPGVPAQVKVFDDNLRELRSFLPDGPEFTGGVSVAVGDVEGDGDGNIVTGPGLASLPS